jgi:diguanylate cyclase (GGDEF)-like protein
MNEKILIIDDEEEILEVLAEVFEEEGYQVKKGRDGEHGIAVFFEWQPDLVITDVKMPKKNGLEVLKAVKDSGSDVDVIILTGHSDEMTAIECLRTGAYDYLLKPVEDIAILLVAAERALGKRRLTFQNQDLLRQLAEQALKDPMTGLPNYRHLQTCLNEEIYRAKRYKHPFCFCMVDIDHFKVLNDSHGHPFGDFVLQELGRLLQKGLRPSDKVFRYGGEEFSIIMSETAASEALVALDRLMTNIRTHPFSSNGKNATLTVSVGVALCPEQAEEQSALISLADNALYQAKETGRDRVVFGGCAPAAEGLAL